MVTDVNQTYCSDICNTYNYQIVHCTPETNIISIIPRLKKKVNHRMRWLAACVFQRLQTSYKRWCRLIKTLIDPSTILQITQGLIICPAKCFNQTSRYNRATTRLALLTLHSPLPSCKILLNGFSCFSQRMAVWVYWCRRAVHVFSNLEIWKKERCCHFGKGLC